MGKWDKYLVTETSPSSVSKWDKYKVAEPKKEPEGDSWLPLIGKSALKGATSIADLPKMMGTVAEKTVNLGRKTSGNPAEIYWAAQNPYNTNKPKLKTIKEAPQTNYSEYIPSAEGVRKSLKKYAGIDLEPKPDSPAKRIFSLGTEFGTSMLPWAAPAKGGSLFEKFANSANTVGKGTTVGLGSGTLQETGVNPFAADLISGVATPLTPARSLNAAKGVFKGALSSPRKLTQKFMGLGPRSLNIKAAQAARDLGVDLPAAVLTDNVLTGLADQAISKTPIAGNILKNKYDKVQSKTNKHLEDVYNEIGPLDTPDIQKRIADLYDASRTARPEDAVIKPLDTITAINDLDRTLVSDVSSPGRVELKKYVQGLKKKLDPTISTKHGNIKLPIQDYPINKLIDAKVNLNDIIDYDTKGDALKRLTQIKKAVDGDLARYGAENPVWHKNLKEADTLYGNVAKRRNTEKRLKNQATLEADGDFSYAALNKTINNRENRRLLQRDLPPETYEKLLKIGRISHAMMQKTRRIPNPSGTATTNASLAFVAGLAMDPTALASLGATATAAGTTRLLTSKKFLDSALKYAEAEGKHKMKAAMDLNKTTKDITGYTLNSIYRSAQRNMNKEETDGLQ
jgi:hypothetical protein